MFFITNPTANINVETNIAYGAINCLNLDMDVYMEIFDQVYDNAVQEFLDENPDCEDEEIFIDEPSGEFSYELNARIDGVDGVVTGVMTWLGGCPTLLITESPWTRCVSPCSPCLPNAGDLDSGDVSSANGVECYAVPPSWLRTE
jgi:hypothetical protein